MNSPGTGKTKPELSGKLKFPFLEFQRKLFLAVLELFKCCFALDFTSLAALSSRFLSVTNVAPAPCSGGFLEQLPGHLQLP